MQSSDETTVYVAKPAVHDSAHKHVAGEARYVDDMAEPAGLLHLCFGLSSKPHATLDGIDLDAVRAAPGVVQVFTAADIPGDNDVGAMGLGDEPLLAADRVLYVGQPIFLVAATTRDAARRAAKLGRIRYGELPAILDIDAARAKRDLVCTPLTLRRGDPQRAIAQAPRKLASRMRVGGQEHFYLEGQVALALPGEDGDVLVHCSTQHPTEVQHVIARVLGQANHTATVELRRMGGGFGGKETQANGFAAAAGLVARLTGRPAKIRPDRDDDMVITGKRHDFDIGFQVGFDEQGQILGVEFDYAARAGFSADLSGPVTDRALFHCDNAYFYPHVEASSLPLRTHTQSNTAFRGFGGPQGMLGAERVIEEIAYALGLDPLEVRKRNLYGATERNVTPYHQTLRDDLLPGLIDELETRSDYQARRAAIRDFNARSKTIRRGIALTPVKFGISFTHTPYNQAGALLHVYRDGSVQLNHGGTEMGQGLHVKILQIVAETLQIDPAQIRLAPTSTGKIPNTSATAASSGADLNGMAARNAALAVRTRLAEFAAERSQVPPDSVTFEPGFIRVGGEAIPFAVVVEQAYQARVQLSATGFYRTPRIHWNRSEGKGDPFFYFAYGAAVSEAAVDLLTGENRILRTDILHDAGRSLNPAIDIGQIEGGFVQGMGWLTTEELVWDKQGRLRTHAPSTYKIPACSDRPRDFRVHLLDRPNREETIYRSKAVGEPPLMLAMSALHAISDAVASVADYKTCPRLDPPATPEAILNAIERIKP
ncbi:xanthine dehydrogenase molybdopterin binding subunit [Roseiterribacter gracilis]|uniref:Xanthine dehydrogenase molybdopterin binding subunit n=1 Tax=Roseiterribacter gracilis TaxID=2812848 RepID=A0A8S8X997_9PROT|nr:xanthine dehydrogenase molybdopterin binding subunit [Rhodospirillales bacterium TMPK1]